MRKKLPVLLLAVVLAGSTAVHSQVKEVKSFQREMSTERHGDWLAVSTGFTEVFTKRLRHRLSSGFTSLILVDARLEEGKHKVVAQAILQYTILYDIWEEKFLVRREGPGGREDLEISSMQGLIDRCGKVERLALARMKDLPQGGKYKLKVRITVNPVSRELRRRVREYLANPDGSAHIGSPRSFFGSFSRIFVSEKDIQADAVFTYSSPRFELPSK